MDISVFLPKENELPLDILIDGGGMTKIFRSIACIGDSLSSGFFSYPSYLVCIVIAFLALYLLYDISTNSLIFFAQG